MRLWASKSLFVEFLAEQRLFIAAPMASDPINQLDQDPDEFGAIYEASVALRRVQPYLTNRPDEMKILDDFTTFVDDMKTELPIRTSDERFNLLRPLREMLFWSPLPFVQRAKDDPVIMILLAHIYAIAFIAQPFFVIEGGAHFRAMNMRPITQIQKELLKFGGLAITHVDTLRLLEMMEFPLSAMHTFKRRIGIL